MFPSELICKVIDYHGFHCDSDSPTFRHYDPILFSCALVNRTFSYYARSIIFRRVALSQSDRWQALEHLLRTDPVLGSFVKTLVFQFSVGLMKSAPGVKANSRQSDLIDTR